MKRLATLCIALLFLVEAIPGAADGQRESVRLQLVPDAGLQDAGGAMAMTPDGRAVYLLGGIDNRTKLTVAARDTRTGKLSRAACVRPWYIQSRTCATAPGLNNSQALAVSPDGRDVAIAAYPTPQLAVLQRTGPAGVRVRSCFGESVRGFSCRPARAFLGAVQLTISPDGRSVYVAARREDPGLLTFSRDPSAGTLEQLPGANGCLQRQGRPNPERPPCAVVPADWYAPRLTRVTLDGRTVISVSATAKQGSAIFVLRRDPSTGALTPLTCYVAQAEPPCETLPVPPVTDLVVSRDGRTLITSTVDRPVLSTIALDPGTGELAMLRCLSARPEAGCDRGPALEYASLTLTRDGRRLFATNSDFIRVYSLGSDGRVAPIAGNGACVELRGGTQPGCSPLPKRFCCSIGAPLLSPDSRWLYTEVEGNVVAFRVIG